MPQSDTGTFIHELRLTLSPHQVLVLNKRLDVVRQVYNACLGEGLKRLKLMRESKAWQAACKLPKKVKNNCGRETNNKNRQNLFKLARDAIGFSEYALHKYTTTLRQSSCISQHIDSSTAQKTATRAFNALMQYATGKRGLSGPVDCRITCNSHPPMPFDSYTCSRAQNTLISHEKPSYPSLLYLF